MQSLKPLLFVEAMSNHYMKVTEFQYAHYFGRIFASAEQSEQLTISYRKLIDEKHLFRELDIVYYIVLRQWILVELADSVDSLESLMGLLDPSAISILNIRYHYFENLTSGDMQARNTEYIELLRDKDNEQLAQKVMVRIYQNAFGIAKETPVPIREINGYEYEMRSLFGLIEGARKVVKDIKASILEQEQ